MTWTLARLLDYVLFAFADEVGIYVERPQYTTLVYFLLVWKFYNRWFFSSLCIFCVAIFSTKCRKSRYILNFFFFQGFELLLSALGDPSERVVSATHQVFLPAYAAWTTELGNLQFHLIPTLLNKIEKLLRVCVQLFLHCRVFFVSLVHILTF